LKINPLQPTESSVPGKLENNRPKARRLLLISGSQGVYFIAEVVVVKVGEGAVVEVNDGKDVCREN